MRNACKRRSSTAASNCLSSISTGPVWSCTVLSFSPYLDRFPVALTPHLVAALRICFATDCRSDSRRVTSSSASTALPHTARAISALVAQPVAKPRRLVTAQLAEQVPHGVSKAVDIELLFSHLSPPIDRLTVAPAFYGRVNA